MHLVSNGIDGNYLRNLLLNAPSELDWVKAAVAYASGTPELLEFCVDKDVPLTFWGRLDETFPVSRNILKRFLTLGPNYQCKLVWRYFHPKVLWFGGYGAYVGSANLTNSAWYKNIECGVWFTQADLDQHGLIPQLELLFDEIDRRSEPLTDELFLKIEELEAQFRASNSELVVAESKLSQRFESEIAPKISKYFSGLTVVPSKKDALRLAKSAFLEEWNETITILRKISEQVTSSKNRPSWVTEEVPKFVQADQFLHAFYDNKVKPGQTSMHREFHSRNKSNPQKALDSALDWWRSLPSAPKREDFFMYEKAPYLYSHLSKERILETSETEFLEIIGKLHAFVTAARQTRNDQLNLPNGTHLDLNARVEAVGKWMWRQRSPNGSGPLQIFNYVLYGGPTVDIPDRIWEVTREDEWRIPRLGLSSIGEIVGWALPDTYPPRNGRVSKALSSLGFSVKIHNE